MKTLPLATFALTLLRRLAAAAHRRCKPAPASSAARLPTARRLHRQGMRGAWRRFRDHLRATLLNRIARDEAKHTAVARICRRCAGPPPSLRIARRSAAAGCARTPTQLSMDLHGSLALGDVNRLAESYHWVGMTQAQSKADHAETRAPGFAAARSDAVLRCADRTGRCATGRLPGRGNARRRRDAVDAWRRGAPGARLRSAARYAGCYFIAASERRARLRELPCRSHRAGATRDSPAVVDVSASTSPADARRVGCAACRISRQRSAASMPARCAAIGRLWLGWPIACAQVRRCTGPDGSTIFTDRRCADIGGVERLPQAARPARGSRNPIAAAARATCRTWCSRSPPPSIRSDANRLASVYHWTGHVEHARATRCWRDWKASSSARWSISCR